MMLTNLSIRKSNQTENHFQDIFFSYYVCLLSHVYLLVEVLGVVHDQIEGEVDHIPSHVLKEEHDDRQDDQQTRQQPELHGVVHLSLLRVFLLSPSLDAKL